MIYSNQSKKKHILAHVIVSFSQNANIVIAFDELIIIPIF